MFDFYFQSGDFAASSDDFLGFVSDFVVQIAGTFVGAWFAIKLYRRQSRDQVDKDKQARENMDLDNIRYLNFMLTNTIQAAEGLVKSYRQVAFELPKAKNYLPDLEIYASYSDVERIAKIISQGDFYHSYYNLNRSYVFDLKRDSLYHIFANVDSLYNNITNGIAFKIEKSQQIEKAVNSLIKIVVLQDGSIDLLDKGKSYTAELTTIREEYAITSSKGYLDRMGDLRKRAEDTTEAINRIELGNLETQIIEIRNLNNEILIQLNYLQSIYLRYVKDILQYSDMFEQSADYLKEHCKHMSNFIDASGT